MISPLAYVDADAKIGKNAIVHPFAFIDKNVVVGDDCEIMPFASLMSGTRLGNRNRIFNGAVISAEPQDFNFKKGTESFVVIGDDNDIRENVVINCSSLAGESTTIGNGNAIHEGVHIAHDTKIANNCVLGYGCKISGYCNVDNNVICGGNVLVSQGCRIGQHALIQTGCRTRKDVPPYIVAAHEPIEYFGVNDVILQRDNYDEKIIRHMSHAYRIIFQGKGDVVELAKLVKDQVPMSQEIQNIVDFIEVSKLGVI